MKISFAKYQALGNSFIVLDELQTNGRLKKFEKVALQICDATHGVGADGIMVASKKGDDLAVDIYNADGSWAEKSGNGVRIAAMHLKNSGHIMPDKIVLQTGSGPSHIVFHSGRNTRRTISASLGTPVFEAASIPVKTAGKFFINQPVPVGNRNFVASAVSIGNPHLILFCDDFEFDWQSIGEALEVDPLFPKRMNVGFVVVKDEKTIAVRDWERGVGPTESSGTGASAAVAIAVMRGFTDRSVDVETMAGVLLVIWYAKTDEIVIKGPVEYICSGEFELS